MSMSKETTEENLKEIFNEPFVPPFPRKRIGPRSVDAPIYGGGYEPSKFVGVGEGGKMSTRLIYTREELDEIHGVPAPGVEGASNRVPGKGVFVIRGSAVGMTGDVPIYSIIEDGCRSLNWELSLTGCIQKFKRASPAPSGPIGKNKFEETPSTVLVARAELINGEWLFALTEGIYRVKLVGDEHSKNYFISRFGGDAYLWNSGVGGFLQDFMPPEIGDDQIESVTVVHPNAFSPKVQSRWKEMNLHPPLRSVITADLTC